MRHLRRASCQFRDALSLENLPSSFLRLVPIDGHTLFQLERLGWQLSTPASANLACLRCMCLRPDLTTLPRAVQDIVSRRSERNPAQRCPAFRSALFEVTSTCGSGKTHRELDNLACRAPRFPDFTQQALGVPAQNQLNIGVTVPAPNQTVSQVEHSSRMVQTLDGDSTVNILVIVVAFEVRLLVGIELTASR